MEERLTYPSSASLDCKIERWYSILFVSWPLSVIGLESRFAACGAEVLMSRAESTLVDIVRGVEIGGVLQFNPVRQELVEGM